MKYDKKFLVIGSMNAMSYKNVFNYLNDDKIWIGINSVTNFQTPEGEIKGVPAYWFTNLENKRRNEEIYLYERYTPEKYPIADNYNLINIDKVREIPKDYYGYMAVPMTFFLKHNPNQFKILGCAENIDKSSLVESLRTHPKKRGPVYVNDKSRYIRIIIQRIKQPD